MDSSRQNTSVEADTSRKLLAQDAFTPPDSEHDDKWKGLAIVGAAAAGLLVFKHSVNLRAAERLVEYLGPETAAGLRSRIRPGMPANLARYLEHSPSSRVPFAKEIAERDGASRATLKAERLAGLWAIRKLLGETQPEDLANFEHAERSNVNSWWNAIDPYGTAHFLRRDPRNIPLFTEQLRIGTEPWRLKPERLGGLATLRDIYGNDSPEVRRLLALERDPSDAWQRVSLPDAARFASQQTERLKASLARGDDAHKIRLMIHDYFNS